MSVEALGAALAEVGESLREGYQLLRVAQQRLAEAGGVLVELGANHSESLVPPQLHAANDVLGAALNQLAASMAATERFAAAL
ncbi:MAG TPA: hypothetical protein VHX38_09550 [Pseudonocardiaceae bacterium]|nr:hypothetical protein [Pseudonocardiaceae bacterium]